MADVDTIKKIVEIQFKNDELLNGIKKAEDGLEDLNKQFQKLEEEKAKGLKTDEEYRDGLISITAKQQALKTELRGYQKELQNNIKEETAAEGSIKQMEAQVANLTKQYKEMSQAEREGAKGIELKNKINTLNTDIRLANKNLGDFRSQVGTYEEAMRKALIPTNGLLGQLAGLTSSAPNFKAAMGSMTSGVQALGGALKALLFNPIILAIAAVTLAVKGLVTAIQSSEEQTNRWNIIIAPLKRTLNELLAALQYISGAILSLIEFNQKLHKAMFGWLDRLIEKLPGIGALIKQKNDAIQESIELTQREQQLTKQARIDKVQEAKDEKEIERLKQESRKKDIYTAEERLAFNQQAIELERQIAERNKKRAEEEFEIAKRRAEWAQNDAKANDELAEKEAAYHRAETAFLRTTQRLVQQEQALKKEIASEDKAAADEAERRRNEALEKRKAAMKTEIDAIRAATDAQIALIKDGLKKQAAEEQVTHRRRIQELKKRLDEEQNLTAKARAAINKQIELEEQRHLQAMDALNLQALEKRIKDEQKLIELQLETARDGSDAEFTLKIAQLQKQMEAELASTELTEQMKLLIREKYEQKMNDATNQWLNKRAKDELNAIKLQYQNRIDEAALQGQNTLKLELEQKKAILDALQQLEGESNDEFRARQLAAQKDYVKAEKAIADYEVSIQQQKADAFAKITNGLLQIMQAFGDENKAVVIAAKALALAEIAINTGKAIAAGVAQSQDVPFPGNIAAIATTVATILANIGTAISTVKGAKFAEGGLVTGGSGTKDDVPIMAMGGEAVMTKQAVQDWGGLLSMMNVASGGAPLVSERVATSVSGSNLMGEMLAKAMKEMPAPVVSVVDINKGQRKVRVLDRMAKL